MLLAKGLEKLLPALTWEARVGEPGTSLLCWLLESALVRIFKDERAQQGMYLVLE